MSRRPASSPSRRSILRAISVGAAGSLAGCSGSDDSSENDRVTTRLCGDPVGPLMELRVQVSSEESFDAGTTDLTIVHENYRVDGDAYESVLLRIYDEDRQLLVERDIGPIAESNEWLPDHEDGNECFDWTWYEYTKTVTVETNRVPRYVNPFVPLSECRRNTVALHRIFPLAFGDETGDPGTFTCGQAFPFAALDLDASRATGWPTRGFDAGRSGSNPAGTGPAALDRTVWERPIGDADGPPRLAYGGVYVPARHAPWGWGSPDRGVVALDAATGALLWQWERREVGPAGHLTVAEGRVYVPGEQLLVLDAVTGDPLWKGDVGMPRTDGVLASPIVSGGRAYGIDGSSVVAFGTESGDRRWEYRADESPVPLAAGSEHLYVGTADSIAAVDVTSGDERWTVGIDLAEVPFRDGLRAAVAVDDDVVHLVGADDGPRLVTLRTDDGAERWSRPLSGPSRGLVGGDGTVYAGVERSVVAFTPAEGEVRWEVEFDYPAFPWAAVGEHLYVWEDETLRVLDPPTGETIASQEFDSRLPAIADGRAYVAGDDGVFRAVGDG